MAKGSKCSIYGQVSIFDFPEFLPATDNDLTGDCSTCGWDTKGFGICGYNTRDDYCVLGDKWKPKDDFQTMTIERAAEIIGNRTGLKFKQQSSFNEFKDMYCAKKKELQIDIEFANYASDVRDGRRHLGVGYSFKTQGGGSPCESIDEAITYIQEKIDSLIKNICKHSNHTCNKEELWKVANTLDGITCNKTCCRQCSVRMCGARCNGSEEPKLLEVDIRGMLDDGYCPKCNIWLDDLVEECPECHARLDWTRWKKMNEVE